MSLYRRRFYAPLLSLTVCAGIVLLSISPTYATGGPSTKTGSPAGKTPPAAKTSAKSTPALQRPVAVVVPKTTPKPVAPAAAKPVAQATAKPVAKTTPKPVAKITPKPVAKATPKPVAKTTPKPVAKATPKPVAKTTPKPVAKATPKPVAKITPKPVAKTTPKPVAKTTPKPVAKATPKPVAKTTPTPTVVARSGTSRGGARPAPIAAPKQPAKVYTVESGIAMHYYQGLMQTVARNQGLTMRTDVDGYTSRQNCGEIGSIVEARLLNPHTGQWSQWLRLQVLDCSARSNVAYHRSIGLILEVDYNTAVRTGFVSFGRTEAEVRH